MPTFACSRRWCASTRCTGWRPTSANTCRFERHVTLRVTPYVTLRVDTWWREALRRLRPRVQALEQTPPLSGVPRCRSQTAVSWLRHVDQAEIESLPRVLCARSPYWRGQPKLEGRRRAACKPT